MNERKSEQAMRWWRIWLTEMQSAEPDLMQAVAAAQQLAAYMPSRAQMRQWLAALASDVDDPLTCDQSQLQLPDFLAAQIEPVAGHGADSARFADLRKHLVLCPSCTEAYAQTAEWMVAGSADSVPVTNAYPTFDFSFLTPTQTTTQSPPASTNILASTERLQEAAAAGKRWLEDAMGGLFVLFGPGLQSRPAAAWAIKSGEAGALLAQTVLTEEEIKNWEVSIGAFAQEGSDALCLLEVALYQPGVTLEGITVTLSMGEEERRGQTDAGGVVTFADIPMAHLDQVIVHIALRR